ncbi:hypothetical protein LZ667_22190 [Hafnia alvei]|uniref:phage tail fiber protein n=1 Tax=Hafnia alvei TaxID=569 RepID=UPI001F27EDEB|nr:hypothetical protein [Hafnia alvei]MCE9874067.1 hypothetical protein [Hafnia alvei]
MSLYETGTITGALNATTISGTGTKWSDAKNGIANGSVIFVASAAGMDGVYQVKRVINDTSIELSQPIYKAFTNSKYSILIAEASSTAAWSNQLSATIQYYLEQMNGWQQIMTGTGDVELTAPDGTKVTIKSFTALDKNKADKSALGTAAWVNTGANKGNILLNKQAYNFTTSDIVAKADAISSGVNIMAKLFDGSYDKLLGPDGPDSGVPVVGQNGTGYSYATCYSLRGTNRTILFVPYATSGNSGSLCWRGAFGNEATPLVYTRDTRNTTVDSSGFIKAASPIIKIFSDGSFETNDESEGAQVKRESVGVYRISNILGPHSDKAWGGIDGGFEIPKDRNGQRLLWLDYEVDADGSILVKTYHRTYPEAPAFARNIKDGYEESDPIDIPSDQFVSVRVEMPQDSIWNLAQKAAQEEMAQEEIAEE